MKRLDQLIGSAKEHLLTLLRGDRLPHALLFVGPEGTGKFMAAQALAQTVLCRQRKDSAPCGACGSCLKFQAQSHADLTVLTTEDKSIKIDQVREAERALRLRPVEGDAKFFLIEDAHRVTLQAQNALLKTLEEPPGNSYIVLTTVNLRAILPTVVSRCQRISFQPMPLEQIRAHLVEHQGISNAHAQMIAALSQGSLGAAIHTAQEELEQLLERRNRAASLDVSLNPGAYALDALDRAAELAEDRHSMGQDLEMLMIWLHDQMVLASGSEQQALANADQSERLEQLANKRGLKLILERTRAVMRARQQLSAPFNLNAQMLAEELCLSLAGHTRLQNIDR